MRSNSIPSYEQAVQLLHACGCGEDIIKHVQAVSEYGVEIAESCSGVNVDLVRIGGLLHDIGRCQSHTIDHGIGGAQLLRRKNVDEKVVHIVERHVGAGITAEEAARLGLPPGTYIPQTIEEKIVAAVDNLIDGSKRVSIEEALIGFQREVKDPMIVDRMRRLHEDVFNKRCHFSAD